MIKTSLNDYRFKLLLIFVFFLFIVKLVYSNQFFLVVFNILIDFSVLYLIYLLFSFRYNLKSPISKLLEKVIYYFLFFFNVLIFTVTSYYFNDAMEMKYSLFQFNIGHAGFFISSILQIWLLVLFILISMVIILISLKKWKSVTYSGVLLLLIPLLIFLSSLIAYPYTNNIYSLTSYDFLTSATQEYFEIQPSNNYSQIFIKEIPPNSTLGENQRVLIFVMEQTTYKEFTKEVSKLPHSQNFFEKIKNSSHWYTNYYTTNQDSRTGIWTMLLGKTIPFEAYSTYWSEQYGSILTSFSLVDVFNKNQYQTTAVASMYEPSLILGALNWSSSLFLQKYPYDNSICIHEFEYQKGCEDMVMLPRVIKEISEHNELLLFQELIYGHGEKYLQQGKKTRVEYYNDYFFEIYSYLEQTNKLENTTIIITSDHGNKGYYTKELDDYQVPLIVYNSKLNYSEKPQLISHLFFSEIVLSYTSNISVSSQEEVFIQGQTQSGELAYVNSNNSYYTIQNIPFKGYKIVDTNKNISFIKSKVSQLLSYKQDVEEQSISQNNHCEYCSRNSQVIYNQRE